MTEPLVSILDDEPDIRALLAGALEEAGYRTQSFGRAAAFEAALKTNKPDVCLIDLGLPDKDGLALVHKVALDQGSVVIIISGRAHVQDRVTGLELGADDYIIKPFDPAEVVARIRARLRRPKAEQAKSQSAEFAGWRVAFERFALYDAEENETSLSQAESEILRLFLENPKRLLTRAQMQEVLGSGVGDSFDRAMDVRVSRLRTKLKEDPRNPTLIKTIYGAGYIFLGEVTWL